MGAVLDALKPRLDGRQRYLLGHSLGGQACALHLALHDGADVDGLILVAVGLPWYRSYPGRRRFGRARLHPVDRRRPRPCCGVWPGWGFGGRQARGVIRDWGYTARHGRFPRLDGVDVEAALATVRTPVLAISVDADQYTPRGHPGPPLRASSPRAPIERVHLHRAILDHFTWVRASTRGRPGRRLRVVEFVSVTDA